MNSKIEQNVKKSVSNPKNDSKLEDNSVASKDSVVQKTEESNKNSETFEISPESITDSQLDPVYIQALINKINALEKNSATIDRMELLRLNTELDAILRKLEQQ